MMGDKPGPLQQEHVFLTPELPLQPGGLSLKECKLLFSEQDAVKARSALKDHGSGVVSYCPIS